MKVYLFSRLYAQVLEGRVAEWLRDYRSLIQLLYPSAICVCHGIGNPELNSLTTTCHLPTFLCLHSSTKYT